MKLTEKVNPIKVKDLETNHTYVLDFNRETVEFAEARGFTWDEVGDKPATLIPMIWFVAFRRHEPRISKAKTDKLLEDKGGLKPKELKRLRELYDQCLAPLIADDEDEEDAKNAKVTVELD